MIKYEKYKSTDVMWFPELPEHWGVFRFADEVFLRHGFQFRDYDFTDTGTKIVKISQLNPQGYLDLENCSFIDSSRLKSFNSIRIKDGDILMALTGGTIGKIIKVKKVEEPLLQNYRVGNFFPNEKKINKSYLFYLLASQITELQIDYLLNRNGQPNIGKQNFKAMFFCLPLLSEQKAIAQYLDTKTQAIDKKISLLNQKIDYYKELRQSLINDAVTKGLDKEVTLKDSEIDWISQIPQHWEIKRFKEVVLRYTTGGTPSTSNISYFNGDNIWVCIGDINHSNIINDSNIKLTDEAIIDANIVKTPKGSLLYSFKLSIGKMAFADCDLYTNEAIVSIFPNKNIDLMYYYFMLPIFMDLAATENIYGAKMLNQKLIANALLVHPPKEEQSRIAQYLDEKTSTIDAIVNNIKEQIEKLQELRKTLINDVVIGKIKVTE